MADEELPGLNEGAIERIHERGSELSAARKQRGRRLPEGLVEFEALDAFQQTACHSGIHSTDTPGIMCMDLQVAGGREAASGKRRRFRVRTR